jgi:hypothetical protein
MSEDAVARMRMLKAVTSMKMTFSGTYEELQDDVKLTGIYGEWRDLGKHKQFRSDTGAILNWWQSTGAITFQGTGLAAEEFEAKLFDAFGDGREIIPPELLRGLTADKIDWERSTLIDDEGRLWFDLMLSRDGVEAIKGGKKAPIFVCGRRARH